MKIKELSFKFAYRKIMVGKKQQQRRYQVGLFRDANTRRDVNAGDVYEVVRRQSVGEECRDISRADWRTEPDSVVLNASLKTTLGELPEELGSLPLEEAVAVFTTESAGDWFMFGWHDGDDLLHWLEVKLTWKQAAYFLSKVCHHSGGKWRIADLSRDRFLKYARLALLK